MHVAVQHVCSYAKHITSKNQDSPVVEGWNSGERCFSINCNEVIEIVEPQCINSHKTTKINSCSDGRNGTAWLDPLDAAKWLLAIACTSAPVRIEVGVVFAVISARIGQSSTQEAAFFVSITSWFPGLCELFWTFFVLNVFWILLDSFSQILLNWDSVQGKKSSDEVLITLKPIKHKFPTASNKSSSHFSPLGLVARSKLCTPWVTTGMNTLSLDVTKNPLIHAEPNPYKTVVT